MERRALVIGHSPDPDDAYMFYGLKAGKTSFSRPIAEFLADIETLNRLVLAGRLDVSAVSAHVLGLTDRYYVLTVGASMGIGYGPVLVGREGTERPSLVAVPGRYTTAALLLKLALPGAATVEVPFDRILDAVALGVVDAGLLIHEAQLTYRRHGLVKLLDLGEWWERETRLPLPLGLDVVRKDLGMDLAVEVRDALRESLRYAELHREEVLKYAHGFARGLTPRDTERFVDMYVNRLTLDMGHEGKRAVERLLQWGHDEGLLKYGEAEFV